MIADPECRQKNVVNWKRLWCLIGVHDWKYASPRHDADRHCLRCSKQERAEYDMMYGETFYVSQGGGG